MVVWYEYMYVCTCYVMLTDIKYDTETYKMSLITYFLAVYHEYK